MLHYFESVLWVHGSGGSLSLVQGSYTELENLLLSSRFSPHSSASGHIWWGYFSSFFFLRDGGLSIRVLGISASFRHCYNSDGHWAKVINDEKFISCWSVAPSFDSPPKSICLCSVSRTLQLCGLLVLLVWFGFCLLAQGTLCFVYIAQLLLAGVTF